MAAELKTVTICDPQQADPRVLEFLYAAKPSMPALAAEKWVWRYVRSPAGKGTISLIVDEARQDRIVAHNALARCRIAVKGELITVGRSGGQRVEQDYRSRGLLLKLRSLEDRVARSQGVPLITALPNRVSTPGCLLTGYRFHQHFAIATGASRLLRRGALRRPVPAVKQAGLYLVGRLVRDRSKLPPPDDLRIDEVDGFGEPVDRLWERLARRGYLGICKDSTHLNWRYLSRPDTTVFAFLASVGNTPRALCIIEKYNSSPASGWVAELLAGPEDEHIALEVLRQAQDHVARLGVRTLKALIDGVSVTGSVVQRLGYVTTAVRPFMIRPLDREVSEKMAGPWQHSMGDFMTGS